MDGAEGSRCWDDGDLPRRLHGAVWGHLLGDAMGVPYEFRSPDAVGEVRFGERGSHGVPAGTWSDDGALMLALLDSLLSAGFDPSDQGRRALEWYRRGAYTPDGLVFDVGSTTRRALRAIEAGSPAASAGPRDEVACGNGSLMRILPIALVGRDLSDFELVDRAHKASAVTHGHPRCQVACALYSLIVRRLLAGERDLAGLAASSIATLRALYGADPALTEHAAALVELEAWPERCGSGYVLDAFWSAWDAFAGADSIRSAIERAIRYGRDTDTTAAIAGGLAGARFGCDALPADWRAGMQGHAVVAPLVDRLVETAGWTTSSGDPLRVDFVDLGKVPALEGCGGGLGMTFLPGKRWRGYSGPSWRDLEADADRLADHWRANTFLLLVEDHEIGYCGVAGIGDALARRGIELLRHPVRDMDVPDDTATYRRTLDAVRARLDDGQTVVVACRGGLGRTGTAVACLLRDAGLDAASAIALTRAARAQTIERGCQVEFVRAWGTRRYQPDSEAYNPRLTRSHQA